MDPRALPALIDMRIRLAALVVLLSGCGAHHATPHPPPTAHAVQVAGSGAREPRLVARAILRANAFQPGPPSGALASADNGVTPPFPAQPIPGFSAVLDAGDDTFRAMPDNGFGAKTNSGDFLLRLYRIRPDFKTAAGGTGTVAVLGFAQLHDPDRKIPFPLVRDGRMLHPILEGALRDDPDPRRRVVHEFSLEARVYTGRTWHYRVDAAFPDAVIGDFTALDQHRSVIIERDDLQGAAARHKKVYLINLRHLDGEGALEKRLVLDLLAIPDPAGISSPAREGEFGVGDPFSLPLQSVESLAVLGAGRLLIANDNNYPASDGRWIRRDRPDDIELVIVEVPGLR